jgi:hypothetical protein
MRGAGAIVELKLALSKNNMPRELAADKPISKNRTLKRRTHMPAEAA